MSGDLLLIDQLYRGTFDKRYGNPDLRRSLQEARRFVLDDGMTAFLIDLVWHSMMFGRVFRQARHGQQPNMKAVGKRVFRALDNMRYFSRLPHRVTWVEFSAEAFSRRQLAIAVENGIETVASVDPDGNVIGRTEQEEIIASSKGVRFGWLMRQMTETSFDCSAFTGGAGPQPTCSQTSLVWDTENNVPPVRLIEPDAESRGYRTGAEMATGMRGYQRDNVGYRICVVRKSSQSLIDYTEDTQHSIRNQHGRLRYIWMFLSTLNKIPLVNERVVKPSRGFMGRGSYRKFLEHSVITLNVPQKAKPGVFARKVLGDIIRRRAHQVRGHWRDDWRQPKGNKALWIAEHQRGDASIGFVTHDYAVHHGDER